MHAAIAGARLHGESRVVSFAEKTRMAVLAANGVDLFEHDAPREVPLSSGTTATYWIEEVRPGLVCRRLTLTQTLRPSAGEMEWDTSRDDLSAILGDYGFKNSLDRLGEAGGVRHEYLGAQDRITVYEPLSGDLSALESLCGSETDQRIPALLDPATMDVVAQVGAAHSMSDQVTSDMARAIDRIDLSEPS